MFAGKFLVEVHFISFKNNNCSRRMIVSARTVEAAIDKAHSRLKNCAMRFVGGDVVPVI